MPNSVHRGVDFCNGRIRQGTITLRARMLDSSNKLGVQVALNVAHVALTDPTEGYLPAQVSASSGFKYDGSTRGNPGRGGMCQS